jgi:hypothetical protein
MYFNITKREDGSVNLCPVKSLLLLSDASAEAEEGDRRVLQVLASSRRLQQIMQTSHHAKLQHTPPSRGSSLASAFDDGLDGTRTELADEEHYSLVLLLAELALAGIFIIYGILCMG